MSRLAFFVFLLVVAATIGGAIAADRYGLSSDDLSNYATYVAVALTGAYFAYRALSGTTMNPGLAIAIRTRRTKGTTAERMAIEVDLRGGDAASIRLHDVAVDLEMAGAERTWDRLASTERAYQEFRVDKIGGRSPARWRVASAAPRTSNVEPAISPNAGSAEPTSKPMTGPPPFRDEYIVLSPGDATTIAWLVDVPSEPVIVNVTIVGRRHPVDIHGYASQWRASAISFPAGAIVTPAETTTSLPE